MSRPSAREEWAAAWWLPLLGMLGIAGSATFAYSGGVFMSSMTREFGWSRSQFSGAFAVQMLLGLIVGPLVGRLVDRVGPRRVGIVGIFLFVAGLSAMGLADGRIAQWWVLGGLQALCTSLITATIWLGAVVPRFRTSRGLALAVALAGIGVATAVWPILAALGIQSIGWRATFPALAAGWAVLTLPFAWFCLVDPPAAPLEESGATPVVEVGLDRKGYLAALRSRSFICLTLAGGIFAGACYGLILHLIPMLEERGLTLDQAAGLSGVMGLFVILGRLSTGYLLDHLPTRAVGVSIFMLPVPVCLLLWLAAGSKIAAIAAVVLLGLATGSETDVVVFMIAATFSRDIFASVYSVVYAVFALLAAGGPLLAGGIYDAHKSYDLYLAFAVPMLLLATLFIALVPSIEREASVTAPHASREEY